MDTLALAETLRYFPESQDEVHRRATARHAAISQRLKFVPLSSNWSAALQTARDHPGSGATGLAHTGGTQTAEGTPSGSHSLLHRSLKGTFASASAHDALSAHKEVRPVSSASTQSSVVLDGQTGVMVAKVDGISRSLQAMCLEVGQLLYAAKVRKSARL